MTNKVIPTPIFERKFKRLSKKFSSLASEIENLEDILIEKPESGISLGANIYKIRLANKDKGKGKSSGFRIVTYLVYKTQNSTDIYLLTIFDKSEESSIDKTDLVKLVKQIFSE
jgi:mRNA-degrading endonuclease RelE of RelBE toxin-antitoxin system